MEKLIKLNEKGKYFGGNLSCSQDEFEFVVDRFYGTASPEEIQRVEELVRTIDRLENEFDKYLPEFQEAADQFVSDLEELSEVRSLIFEDGNPDSGVSQKIIQNALNLEESTSKVEAVKNHIERLGELIKEEHYSIGQCLWYYRPERERESYSWPFEENVCFYEDVVRGLSHMVETLSENLEKLK